MSKVGNNGKSNVEQGTSYQGAIEVASSTTNTKKNSCQTKDIT
jgi:hypothetical protein